MCIEVWEYPLDPGLSTGNHTPNENRLSLSSSHQLPSGGQPWEFVLGIKPRLHVALQQTPSPADLLANPTLGFSVSSRSPTRVLRPRSTHFSLDSAPCPYSCLSSAKMLSYMYLLRGETHVSECLALLGQPVRPPLPFLSNQNGGAGRASEVAWLGPVLVEYTVEPGPGWSGSAL